MAYWFNVIRPVRVRTRTTIAVLSSALKQTVKWDMFHRNPASAVNLPRMVRKEMKAMSPVEISRFLEAVKGTRQYALFNFALTTGMRPPRISRS